LIHGKRRKYNVSVETVAIFLHTVLIFSGNLSDIALGYGLDDGGFESRQELGIFLFITISGPALGPIQPPIQ
jgi:hypothetical protein